MYLLLVLAIFSDFLLSSTYQSSCHNTKGVSLCNARNCPKMQKCKGNMGKDSCACCSVCLKQENETCEKWTDCDHHVPVCEKKGDEETRKCVTVKTALLNNPAKTKKLQRCHEYSERVINDQYVRCLLKYPSPQIYCRKKQKLKYIKDFECCWDNGCNPDPNVYEWIPVNLKLSFMETRYKS